MVALRIVTLFVAMAAITAPDAGAEPLTEPHRGESRTKGGTPIALTIRGGVLQGNRFSWTTPPTEGTSSLTIPAIGISLEAHGVHGFIVGAGFDASKRDWSIQSPEIGRRARSLTTYSAYGTLGAYLWAGGQSRPITWISIDAGKIWAEESGGQSVSTVKSGSLKGALLRLRASGMWPVAGWLALGGDVGWQWARPSMHYDGDEVTHRLDLSGPVMSACVSLVGPLGK